ncbi:alpha/beta fold hydrolase [Bacillus sp. B-jedd]|uniref:alpha/beta fold hydrolase n=1 Tax=Bacillus sp. B-jedd TaxID=1476857 RepID=UPI0005156217|nr:alpha/beta hydrolase [Bacillus sp. B-jedd]CEG27159.1 prolyl aminopeptidase [Bacillus sp. B-jedd]
MTYWDTEIIDTPRGTFEIFTKGKGTPVCITHHYSEFNNTGDYFAETFTDDNKVILVNLKGTGNSSQANEAHELSMLDAVYDLEAIRSALGLSSWVFAGHSTGGMIGVLYGIHFPESLNSLILVGSAARKYNVSPLCIYHTEHPQFDLMQNYIQLLKQSDLCPIERHRLTEERTKLSLYRPEQYKDYFSLTINKGLSASRLNFFAREAAIFDITRELGQISTRTLILCGKYDVQCPVSFSIEMNELIPNSHLVVFEESNHYPFLEEGPLFREVTNNFLKQISNSN